MSSKNGKTAFAQLERWLGKIFLAGIFGATVTAATFILNIHKELVELRQEYKALQHVTELANKNTLQILELEKELEIYKALHEIKK